MKTKVAFIVNSKRKISSLAEKTLTLVRMQERLDCHFYNTESKKHAITLAKECADKGFDCILAVGGDGTANEVINGLKLSKRTLGVYFGIIPNGSGNDFQTVLESFEPEEFVEKLVSRQSNQMDIIKLTSQKGIYYAMNIAGIGFDGFVINTLQNLRRKYKVSGKFAYVLSILTTFLVFKKATVKITGDHFNYNGKLLMLCVCNGSTFGHGLTINPDANPFDEKLNVTILGNVSFFDYVRKLSLLKSGKKVEHSEVHYFEAEKVSIQLEKRKMFSEVDGEIFDSGNITFEILKGDISLIC